MENEITKLAQKTIFSFEIFAIDVELSFYIYDCRLFTHRT